MSTDASPTLPSRRRQRSITADPKTAPLSFGTLTLSLPALTVGSRSQCPARYAFPASERPYLAVPVSSSAPASGIAFGS
jgi:hypothetical protein